jgi:hypothetical protein
LAADGEAVGLSLLCGLLGVLWLPLGKKAKKETNKTATIATTIRHFAFLLNRHRFCLKKPFLRSASREASKETSLRHRRENELFCN